MNRMPVVSHHEVRIGDRASERALRLADDLRAESPRLVAGRRAFRGLALDGPLEDLPTLHIDDFSDISIPLPYSETLNHLEDRARMRARDGDVVASSLDPTSGYEEYCRRWLGLGEVTWICPRGGSRPRSLALACWADREARDSLKSLIRRSDLRYLHPHMGSFAVWALASLLSDATGCKLRVIAPPPALTRAVNDKLWFASVVRRLFGDRWVPRTEEAYSFSTISLLVRDLASEAERIVIKLPDSAGGGGNLVLDPRPLRRLSLGALRSRLKELLLPLDWEGRRHLLVGCWESEALASPSAQLWIPPAGSGPPIVEGVFEQILEGPQGFFIGNQPAKLGERVTRRIVDAAALLATLFQELGYVGRCSFDLLLVGSELDHCRVEFIECNGRWGGTSLPMTLMNRLFGDWATREYCCIQHRLPVDAGSSVSTIVEQLGDAVYDARTGSGRLILFNAAGLASREIGVIGVDSNCALTLDRLERQLRQGVPPAELVDPKARGPQVSEAGDVAP